MALPRDSSVAYGTTGVKHVTSPNAQPVKLNMWVGSLFGGEVGTMHFCRGETDGTRQFAHWQFADGEIFAGDDVDDCIISVWENQGGALVEVLRVEFVAFTATGFDIDIIIANPNYNIYYEAE